jgi:hypothetical protein
MRDGIRDGNSGGNRSGISQWNIKLEDQGMNTINAPRSVSTSPKRRLGCCICGFSEIRTDEVVDRGILFLAECPRCEYRWTSQEPIAAASTTAPAFAAARFQRVSAVLSREIQSAA